MTDDKDEAEDKMKTKTKMKNKKVKKQRIDATEIFKHYGTPDLSPTAIDKVQLFF